MISAHLAKDARRTKNMEVTKMERTFRIEKDQRKQLAHKLAELTGASCKYLGVPSCAYQIGEITVALDGTIDFGDAISGEELENLLARLAKAGFLMEETPIGQENLLIVEMPADLFDDRIFENLDRILENKGTLIKNALQTPHLHYEVVGDKVRFPWFTIQQDGNADAYCQFISALHAMARDQKRINHCPDTSTNEKYAFRCFLIRLGFVGSEYKHTRKVLLRYLTGSSAFRNGGEARAVSE